MMWQDVVFLLGSMFSIFCLAPTLRDADARVPLATSAPSMAIGGIYAFTFATLGMSVSAIGAVSTCAMWSLIAMLRAPLPETPRMTRREELLLFAADVRRWLGQHRAAPSADARYALD